ncbi:hypothetical protein V493_07568 [Pseudogymnoascus sp. VKM F-4281 (FW-2241)]|nr:hypothetical protein V493_07568 [Pseudogymnoascus sp. VKM F-4281 (FW-2241)]
MSARMAEKAVWMSDSTPLRRERASDSFADWRDVQMRDASAGEEVRHARTDFTIPTVWDPQSTSHITSAYPSGIATPAFSIWTSHFPSSSSTTALSRSAKPSDPGPDASERGAKREGEKRR